MKMVEQNLPKFGGEGKEEFCDWLRHFKGLVRLQGLEENKAVLLLPLCLNGAAGSWYDQQLEEEAADDWSLDKWLQQMRLEFGSTLGAAPAQLTTRALSEVIPKGGEDIADYNERFASVLRKIPKKRLDLHTVKDHYLGHLEQYRYGLWNRVAAMADQDNVDWRAVATAVATWERRCKDFPPSHPAHIPDGSKVKGGKPPTEEVASVSMDHLERLTAAFDKLALVQRPQGSPHHQQGWSCYNCGKAGHRSRECPGQREAAVHRVRCFNCNDTGHYSPDCPMPRRPREQQSKTNDDTRAMLSIEATSVPSKRVRVEDLVNTESPARKVVPPKLGNRPAIGVKRKVKAKTPQEGDFPQRLLNSRADLTVQEVFQLNPRLADTTIRALQHWRRTRQPKSALLGANTQDDKKELQYIVVEVAGEQRPVYVDSGARHSAIRRSLVESLGLETQEMEEPLRMTSFQNRYFEMRECVLVNVTLADRLTVPISFAVIEECPVALLFGTDVLAGLTSSINYGTETLDGEYDGEEFSAQLYTPDNLEELGVATDTEDSPMLLMVQRADLMGGVGLPEANDTKKPALDLEHVAVEEKLPLEEVLGKHEHLFAESQLDCPGIKDATYRCELEPGSKPFSAKARRYAPHQRDIIRVELDKMLAAKVIEKSASPWSSSVVLVPKKDGKTRFCVDYRRVNEMTVKDKFPLPNIGELVDSLGGKRYYSTLDCFAGYWQVPLDLETRPLTAFATPFGLFQFTVMPFGLSNAPAHFSRVMERILSDLLYDYVSVYLDDICIYSSTLEEHLRHLDEVFRRLEANCIRLNPAKCQFLQREFTYLGFRITPEGVRPDPAKVSGLTDSPVPRNAKELRSFMGLASYFRRFVPAFSATTAPMQALLKKGEYFDWGLAQQEAFDKVRAILSTAPVLAMPDFTKEFTLSTDASGYAVGAVLEQMGEDDELHPVAYYSARLADAETRYSAYEREALALVKAVKHFRCYLLGRRTQVWTDNSAVASLFKATDPSGRIVRWVNLLREYDLVLQHRAGKDNPVADFLSRPAMAAVDTVPLDFDDVRVYLETGQSAHPVDARFRRTVSKYALVDGILCRRSAPYALPVVPSHPQLLDKLKVLHDQLGHVGFERLWNWVRVRMWRPHLYREVEHFVASCHVCQQFSLVRPAYKFDGQSAISGLFHEWCFDFLGPFPTSKEGARYLLVGVERLTGFPVAIPAADQTAFVVQQIWADLFALFGRPAAVSVDRGGCFVSGRLEEFCQAKGIRLALLPAYQPEWAGAVERLNRTLRYALAKTLDGDYSNWDLAVPDILFGLRAQVSSRTGYSPYYLMFGVEPSLPTDPVVTREPNVPVRHIELMHLPGLRASQERPVRHSSVVRQFPVGSYVMALSPILRKRQVADKKKPRYLGPYRIQEALPHNLYLVQSESGGLATFHASRLVSYVPRSGGLPL
jgi:RNase H-like domain found in reverse transcriptase/Reverse transcriptase (RNA-dependent DNA polymerase)/Integrase zinc binding domain/Integrase core domain/Zinc knuckle/Aspartyl protease